MTDKKEKLVNPEIPEESKEAENPKIEKKKFSIPLAKISYDAKIAGTMASVTSRQEYLNENAEPVEAIYVFPLPDEASVVGCVIHIGRKKIEAELKELKQARDEYEKARDAGHHAVLMEQKRTNIFKMSVGGIEPNEKIKVDITYHQRVEWQDGGGRFVIPTVVAPRFISGVPTDSKTGGGWADDTDIVPDASEITPVVAESVPYTIDIKLALLAGFDCMISSPSHPMVVEKPKLVNDDELGFEGKNLLPDRDFIVCYKAVAKTVETALHTGKFGLEEFAMISIIPPGKAKPQKKRVIVCADCSGSMMGAKMNGLKMIVKDTVERLEKEGLGNEVGIVGFDTEILFKLSIGPIEQETYEMIDKLRANGGTYAGRALDHCFKMLSGEVEAEDYILLVSDGQTSDRWKNVKSGVRVIAVGIDTATNLEYMRDIAKETGGSTYWVYPGEDYKKVAGKITGLLSGPVLRDVKVRGAGDQELPDVVGVADVYEKMPAVISIRGKKLPEMVIISGKNRIGSDVMMGVDIASEDVRNCDFCGQIWARTKLSDEKLSDKERIELSLKYKVLCAKTAFVAVHEKKVPGKAPERVEVPVLMPHTWDYDAVFGPADLGSNASCFAFRGGQGRGDVHMLMASIGDVDDQAYGIGGALEDKGPGAPIVGPCTPSIRPETIIDIGELLVAELEDLVDKLEKGELSVTDSEVLPLAVVLRLKAVDIKGWSDELKAKCYYLVLKLKNFMSGTTTQARWAEKFKPAVEDAVAKVWMDKARKELGIAV